MHALLSRCTPSLPEVHATPEVHISSRQKLNLECAVWRALRVRTNECMGRERRKKRVVLSLADKLKLIETKNENPTMPWDELGRRFDIHPRTARDIFQEGDRLRDHAKTLALAGRHTAQVQRLQSGKYPILDQRIYRRFRAMRDADESVSFRVLVQLGMEEKAAILREVDEEEGQAREARKGDELELKSLREMGAIPEGYIRRWMSRHGVRLRKAHGTEALVSLEQCDARS